MNWSQQHTEYIQEFIHGQDWAGLLRYWRAHGFRLALQAAHQVADTLAKEGGEPHASVAAWLKRMVDMDTLQWPDIPDALRQQLRPDEQIALQIIEKLHALAAFLEDAHRQLLKGGSPSEQAKIEDLLELLSVASQPIAASGDDALENWFNENGATLLLYLSGGVLAAAEQACEVLEPVVAKWKAMAEVRPIAYRTTVMYALGSLGMAQRLAGRYKAALATTEDALVQLAALEQMYPGSYKLSQAQAWSTLAQLKLGLAEPEQAKVAAGEALRITREYLASDSSAEVKQMLAITLTGLGEIELSLSNPDPAFAYYQESYALKQEFIPTYEPARSLLLMSAVVGMAMAEFARKKPDAAHIYLLEAYRLGQQWQEANPDGYNGMLAYVTLFMGLVEMDRSRPAEAILILQEGIRSLDKNLELMPEAFGPDLAAHLHQLGLAQLALGKLADARKSMERAATFVDGRFGDSLGAKVHADLGWLFLRNAPDLGRPDLGQAYHHFKLACRHTEAVRAAFLDEKHRRRLQQADTQLFESHIQNCVAWVQQAPLAECAGVLHEAFWAAEATRSRLLLNRYLVAGWKPQRVPPELAEQLQLCDHMLENLQQPQSDRGPAGVPVPGIAPQSRLDFSTGSVSPPAPSPESQLAQWQAKKAALVAECLRLYPEARLEPGVGVVEAADIFPLIPDGMPTAFVQFAIGADAAFAFILLPKETIRVVKLFPDPPAEGAASPAKPAMGLRAAELAALATDWTNASNTLRAIMASSPEPERAFAATLAWEQAVATVFRQVGTLALDPVVDALPPEIVQVVISPNRALHMFPLHAFPLRDGKLFGERFLAVGYTPSFSVLHRIAQAGPALRSYGQRAPILLLEDPSRDHATNPLFFTAHEIAAVRRRLYQSGLPYLQQVAGSEITQDSLVGDSLNARAIHYSGHGAFEEGSPALSRLQLSGSPATVDDIFANLVLTNNELTCLNCCESGRMMPDDLDDFQNFTTAFLHAGAHCVIATLWAVDDLPSALLMDAFYERLLAGAPPAAALLAAQHHLRSLEIDASLNDAIDCLIPDYEGRKNARAIARLYSRQLNRRRPFDSPLYWAAFTCNGAGFRPVSFSSAQPLSSSLQ